MHGVNAGPRVTAESAGGHAEWPGAPVKDGVEGLQGGHTARRRKLPGKGGFQFVAAPDAQLDVGAVQVAFDRADGDHEALGDLAVCEALDGELHDVLLPSR